MPASPGYGEAMTAHVAAAWSRVASRRLQTFAQWLLLGALVGVACGVASAIFLASLEWATRARVAHSGWVYLLPLAGVGLGWVYGRWGQRVLAGNNLVLDTLHGGGDPIPLRMAPMVLIGTVVTHLFGGSAGREGTAVQMGASLADFLAHRLRLGPELRRTVLTAGIAGGFSSVFGTPIAGLVFGLEVGTSGLLTYQAVLPALAATLVGDQVTRALGIEHTLYPAPASLPLTWLLLGKWILFAFAVAVVSALFIELTHRVKKASSRWLPALHWRMAAGGAGVILLWRLVATDAYLGLGVETLLRAFRDPTLPVWSFALKLLFTAVTLGFGFLGGEVTPLFFIGAALGNALALPLGLPREMAAGVGLAATFAAAANTPLALSVMAVELLGGALLPHVAIVSLLAYLLVGQRGIYHAQRTAHFKLDPPP